MNNLSTKEKIEKLNQEIEKKRQVNKKKIERLREKCDHSFERFSDYGGTDYCCRNCGLWEK